MWWIVPIGIGVGLKILYDVVSEDERNARNRWEGQRLEVERSIEDHRRNIERHINQAQNSYNFQFLVDLHYSSMKVADAAYKLLDDAKKSILAMNKMLKKSKEQKINLQNNLSVAKQNNDRPQISDTIQQIRMLNELRNGIFEDRDKVKAQKESFLAEVKRLNNQTRELKEYIRDRCGFRGSAWYEKLEARKRTRRLSEGKTYG